MVDENQAGNQDGSLQQTQAGQITVPVVAPKPADGLVTVQVTDAAAAQIVEELLANKALKPEAEPPQVVAAPPDGIPQAQAQSPVVVATAQDSGPLGVSDRIPLVQEAAPQAAPVDEEPAAPSASSTASFKTQPELPLVTLEADEASLVPPVMPDAKKQGKKGLGRIANRQSSGTIPVILFEGVTKTYPTQPNKPALSNITLSINAGEFIFLVGHSGSGKSTFIRLINREILATRGKLLVAGEDVIRMRNWRVPYLRRNIGCVFQDFKLLPNKSAFQNVAFALEVIGKSKHIIRTQVPEVLRLVGLEDKLDQLPDQLSGGEQQRVSIARAIVNRPPLLICDEPTGNLDPQTSLGIMRLLDRINRTGTTIVVATHDREMVDSLRKRVVELENGYLVRDQDKGVYGSDA